MSIPTLYFLTRLDSLHAYLVFLSIAATCLLGALAFILFFCYVESAEDETIIMIHKGVKKCAWLAIILGLFTNMMPTNKDLAIILGGYYVTNSEEVKKLPNNVVHAMNDFLSQYADSTKDAIKEVKETVGE